MNRRDFIKTVAATSVTLALPAVASAVPAAPKKLKDGYLSTGHTALDEALGGGIPYYSHVLIAGPPGSGKSTLLDNIYKANGPEWYSKDPGHVMKLETPVAYVRHNIGPSRNPKLPEKYWSFMLVHPIDIDTGHYSPDPIHHAINAQYGPLSFMGQTKAEGHFEKMTVIELVQTTRVGFIGRSYTDEEYIGFERVHRKTMYSDIVIRTAKDHYRIIKNRFSPCVNPIIPKG